MESSKRLIMLLVAGVVVAFIAIAVRNHMANAPSEPGPVVHRVMVAKRDMSAGSSIAVPQDADWAQVSDDIAQKEGVVRDDRTHAEEINGAILRRAVHAGDPLEEAMITRPGGGGLMSAVLEPGMRAVSISVTATSGNAGFVLPGDYVDLILTREFNRQVGNGRESESRKTVYSKTFVENVRVLAADQMLDNPDNKAVVAKTITVEVTPEQAQMVAVAAELGKISVSLRSVSGAGKQAQPDEASAKPKNEAPITDSDITNDKGGAEVSEPVKVLRPGETQNLEFYRSLAAPGASQ